jgi:phospholipid/cholesterol/gamma-HCH transport system substrate-binding protein
VLSGLFAGTAGARRKVAGAAFLALLVMGVWLTYAVFSKRFVDIVPVTLRTDEIGLQLNRGADVKLRGVIVGEVREARPSGNGTSAVLDLALQPSRDVPENVTALIVPKTLFGEKFVDLQVPADPSSDMLRAGDVIEQAEVPIEVEQLLKDLYPLLTAVRPTDLSYTLNAVSTALEGRGERIGQNFVTLDSYLDRFNPLVPTMVDDFRNGGTVSAIYAEAMPNIGRFLSNSSVTGRTVIDQREQLDALYTDVAAFSDTTRGFLETHGDNLIALGRVSVPNTALFAKYSAEYPCLFQAMDTFIPRAAESYRNYTLHINLELIPPLEAYGVDDDPRYGNNSGPRCLRLPNPPYSQQNPGPTAPYEVFQRSGITGSQGKFRPAPTASQLRSALTQELSDPSSGYAGTAEEQRVVDLVVAPALGVDVDRVPDVATLLLGPMARGATVSVR